MSSQTTGAADAEDTTAQFKTAAFALTQLYRSARKEHERGYEDAMATCIAAAESLKDSTEAVVLASEVSTAGRSHNARGGGNGTNVYIPLDTVLNMLHQLRALPPYPATTQVPSIPSFSFTPLALNNSSNTARGVNTSSGDTPMENGLMQNDNTHLPQLDEHSQVMNSDTPRKRQYAMFGDNNSLEFFSPWNNTVPLPKRRHFGGQ